MAELAYQVTGFAYQGSGQFAYQGSSDDTTTVGGVKKRTIRLRDVENREDLADFIKTQMNLKHADLVPEAPKPRLSKKAREAKELEARALENMAIERAQEERRELITKQNNDILTLLMMTEI